MNKIPRFIKKFSKEDSSEERNLTASEIKEQRATVFAERKRKKEIKERLQRLIAERDPILEEKLDLINDLKNNIKEISSSKLRELWNYFRLKKLQSIMMIGELSYEELKDRQNQDLIDEDIITSELGDTATEAEGAQEVLDNFYQKQKQKWINSEYTKEEVSEYFSEEHLSSLSIDDYSLLLQRFPSEIVTHVTRQGVRDHVGGYFHSKGDEEFSTGFVDIMREGRLRSSLGVHLAETEKEKAIEKFLNLKQFKNKEDALESLKELSKKNEPGNYADRTAIHFATEEVADEFYGAEKNNEIFIIYPSLYLASQYSYSGQLNKAGGGYWNDQWVWANEERGMDINAGIVFIPENAKVDKRTGSRYVLDENNKPVKNEKHHDAVMRFINSDNFYNFAEQAKKITSSTDLSFLINDPGINNSQDDESIKQVEALTSKLEKDYLIFDKRLQFALLDYHNLCKLVINKQDKELGADYLGVEDTDHIVDDSLKMVGILFKEVEDPIESRLFWEKYFLDNFDKKPSKIVYYKEADPTAALLSWKKNQGLSKRSATKDMGFPENNIQTDSPRALSGESRFISLAEKIIEDYYK